MVYSKQKKKGLMTKVLFAPGFKDHFKSLDYESLFQALKSKGYKPEFIKINWNRTTIDDWANQLNQEYLKHNPKEAILAGFSFGAMTALAVAAQINPKQLWLFSPSPYFSEDLKSTFMHQSWLKEIGKHRVEAFQKLNFANLAKQINCPTLIFYGEKELTNWPIIQNRANVAKKLIKNNQFFVVTRADHDVTDKRYIQKIKEVI